MTIGSALDAGGAASVARPDFLERLGLLLPCSVEDVKEAYLERAKTAHPDHGGNPDEFVALQLAFEKATAFAEFHAGRRRWLANQIERYAEQQNLVTYIAQLGGRVEVEGLDWMKNEIGEDFAQVLDKVVAIDLRGTASGDVDLALLAEIPARLLGVRSLDLSGTPVTEIGVAYLAAFPSLRRLDLSQTAIVDEVLPTLESMSQLEWLSVEGTPLSLFGLYRLRHHRADLTVVG